MEKKHSLAEKMMTSNLFIGIMVKTFTTKIVEEESNYLKSEASWGWWKPSA
ncbi:hypothetical protein J43TS3_04350 [Ornithinibacillus bavariensis]|uniref:Uncharacterized protein n=1 Tax=Ornithinibacillus bavariensis TaxID=545502 RepID=A0A920C670_9BACI|nr:hypothetical protein J43TS3_04350 [Ornithinibacillus bavariensis]